MGVSTTPTRDEEVEARLHALEVRQLRTETHIVELQSMKRQLDRTFARLTHIEEKQDDLSALVREFIDEIRKGRR